MKNVGLILFCLAAIVVLWFFLKQKPPAEGTYQWYYNDLRTRFGIAAATEFSNIANESMPVDQLYSIYWFIYAKY